MPKSILVVAHDRPLRETRVRLLQGEGYIVKSVATDNDAMAMLENEHTTGFCWAEGLSRLGNKLTSGCVKNIPTYSY